MAKEDDPLPTEDEAAASVALLLQLVSDARMTNCLMTVAISLLLYDYLISLREEIELIWKRRMRFTSYLYIWNRYGSIVGIILSASFMLREMSDDKECVRYLQMEGAASSIITTTVDIVLVYRIWILYAKSKPLLYFLTFLVAGECIVINTLVILTIDSIKTFVHIGPSLTGCYPTETLPSYFKFYVVTMLIVSLIMFILTVHNTFMLLYRYKWRGMPVIRLFLRDGLFWFIGVLAFTVAQAVVLTRTRVTLSEMMIAPTVAVYGTIGSRVVLNIRGILLKPNAPEYGGDDDVASIEMEKVSQLRVIRSGTRNTTEGLYDDDDDDVEGEDSVGTRVEPEGLARRGMKSTKPTCEEIERIELGVREEDGLGGYGFGLGKGYGEAPINFAEEEVPKRMGGLGRARSKRGDDNA
ncbi:hypothetical protein BDQ17DRAFT_368316 [Cyathus striatus]|nr:hypothetical protein BDQ17DRAFT_368316 [Cyathus striatus]